MIVSLTMHDGRLPASSDPAPISGREYDAWIAQLRWRELLRVILYHRLTRPVQVPRPEMRPYRRLWLIAAVLMLAILGWHGHDVGQFLENMSRYLHEHSIRSMHL